MDNKDVKLKFSGISFGGYWGGGTTIFSRHYRLRIEKNMKTKRYRAVIVPKKGISLFTIFMCLALPIDIFYYMMQFQMNLLREVADIVGSFFADLFSWIPSVEGVSVPSIVIPLWVVNIIMYSILIVNFLLLYFFIFRGVATWHGCEHKIIAAAENNDIDNVRNYSRVNDRCGGCFIFTSYFFIAVYWLTLYYVFGILLPVGMMTLTYTIMFLEGKYFHKYNWIGIRVGRILQRKLTTAEPLEFQVKLAISGMKKLVKKELAYARKNRDV